MASQHDFYTSSPSVVLPPPAPDQYFGNSHYVTGDAQMSNDFKNPFTNGNSSPTAGALAGRKRGRDDIHAPDDDGDLQDDRSTTASAGSDSQGSPIYGPGGTVIHPNDPAFAAAAQAQGMMVDQQEGQQQNMFSNLKRPSVSSRKSQRMNRSVNGSDELAQLVLPPNMREATGEPLIDEATRMLGISWTRMDSTEGLSISKAAYEKWIQNHYPGLKDITVWFENSALPGYLVAARNTYNGDQAFYLFSNDLTEARMVTTDPTQLLPRLQLLPALHLAAPGGHLVAHTVAISAAQNGHRSVPEEMESDVGPASVLRGQLEDYDDELDDFPEPVGICAAHSMEMD